MNQKQVIIGRAKCGCAIAWAFNSSENVAEFMRDGLEIEEVPADQADALVRQCTCKQEKARMAAELAKAREEIARLNSILKNTRNTI